MVSRQPTRGKREPELKTDDEGRYPVVYRLFDDLGDLVAQFKWPDDRTFFTAHEEIEGYVQTTGYCVRYLEKFDCPYRMIIGESTVAEFLFENDAIWFCDNRPNSLARRKWFEGRKPTHFDNRGRYPLTWQALDEDVVVAQFRRHDDLEAHLERRPSGLAAELKRAQTKKKLPWEVYHLEKLMARFLDDEEARQLCGL